MVLLLFPVLRDGEPQWLQLSCRPLTWTSAIDFGATKALDSGTRLQELQALLGAWFFRMAESSATPGL